MNYTNETIFRKLIRLEIYVADKYMLRFYFLLVCQTQISLMVACETEKRQQFPNFAKLLSV